VIHEVNLIHSTVSIPFVMPSLLGGCSEAGAHSGTQRLQMLNKSNARILGRT
jgi:hypothetical protein